MQIPKEKSLKSALLSGFCAFTLASTFPNNANALDGHLKGGIFWQDSPKNSQNSEFAPNLDFRLKQQWFKNNWTFALDYQLSGSDSELNHFARQINPYFTDIDRQQLFNLSDVIENSGERFIYQRLDRLNATYSASNYSIKLGRQVMSWGNGQVFNPLDRINPFAPNQIDKSYKPGLDMLTGQYSLSGGDQISWFTLPRRNIQSEKLNYDDSGFGAKWYHFAQNADLQYLLLKDGSEKMAGLEVSQNRDNGLWNLDLVWSYDSDYQKSYLSAVANWQNSITLFKKQAIAFAELYYNGYGTTQKRPKLEQLPQPLINLQSQSKVFVSNRYYAAIGASIELNPLWTLAPSLISNLQDGSQLLNLNVQRSVSDNDIIVVNLQQPSGKNGTEFTGLKSDLYPEYPSYSRQLFIQWQHFFSL